VTSLLQLPTCEHVLLRVHAFYGLSCILLYYLYFVVGVINKKINKFSGPKIQKWIQTKLHSALWKTFGICCLTQCRRCCRRRKIRKTVSSSRDVSSAGLSSAQDDSLTHKQGMIDRMTSQCP